MMLHRILQGDVLKGLASLPDESVHCCITSPPYWGLRAYETEPQLWGGDPTCEHGWGEVHPAGYRSSDTNPGPLQRQGNKDRFTFTSALCSKCGAWRGEIGLEQTPEMYVDHMVTIFREVWRVLRKDGVFFLNMGDGYSPQSSHPASPELRQGLNQRSRSVCDDGKRPPVERLKQKDLVGMPWRLAFALQADGWYWRKWFVWIKRNSMPESTTDRPGSSVEVIHMLVKSGDNLYWTHRDRLGPDGGTRKHPEPDYRWVDRLKDEEFTEEPPGFNAKEKVNCPDCCGLGEVEDPWLGTVWCETCKGKKKVKRWARINLWKGHNYFWDGDAVRVAQTGRAHSRGDGITPKSAEVGHGIKANVSYHEATSKDTVVPGGRNRRDGDWFFESWQGLLMDLAGEPLAMVVNPKPFLGAHFATFAPGLCIPLIKAATSEKGCCQACGAPYARVVEKGAPDEVWKAACGADSAGGYSGESKKLTKQDSLGKSTYTGLNARWKASNPPIPQNASEVKRRILEGMRERKSHWVPTCICNAREPVPAVVLDPFGGSGTVAEVARDLGRSSTLIELNPKYVKMIRERLRIGEQLDTGVCRYEVVEL